jgi:alkaline phosphatase D
MTDLTRRGLVSVGVAGLGAGGLAACETTATGPAANVKFEHGVASGDPTQDAVILWTRVTPQDAGTRQVGVHWFLARDAQFRNVVKRGVFNTGPERDWTVKVDATGLTPGETLYYYFAVGQTASPGGATRTLPATGTADFKAAIVSCTNYPFGFFNVYREVGKRTDLHAVIHLGDYIYEYGRTGYGGEVGRELGRDHLPAGECLTLADYRMRHAQYRADPDAQAAHAVAPWFVIWDDHETANNSHQTGAENHQPDTEGSWETRKAAAVQAYLEWMPVRDPAPGRAREAIYRKFDIGGLATLFLTETRLIARGDDITYDPIGLAADADKQRVANEIKAQINDPNRTLLGAEQEAWLAQGLRDSVAAGRKWQVMANGVLMAGIKAPDFARNLPREDYDKLSPGSKRFWESAKYGLEWNPDSWCGFPVARERLYGHVRAANARLISIAGDTHTAWANELLDARGARVGVEFGCSAVTSNSSGDSFPVRAINTLMTEANDSVVYWNAFEKGYTVMTLKADQVEAEFFKVSTVRSREYIPSLDARFVASANETAGMNGLTRSMGGGQITRG